jgi:hypothetical protein
VTLRYAADSKPLRIFIAARRANPAPVDLMALTDDSERRSAMWRTILLLVVWGLTGAGIQAVAGEWGSQEMRPYYEAQVAWEIDHCLQKCRLMDSRSPALRAKARQEAGKAHYLRSNQEQLVEEMMAFDIGLNHYKVQQYLNQKYHDHGCAYLGGGYCR